MKTSYVLYGLCALLLLLSSVQVVSAEEYQYVKEWGQYGRTGDGYFFEPNGIAVSSSGYVYVADSFNNRIQKFTLNGQHVVTWGGTATSLQKFSHPEDVAVDNLGNVYVADTWNDRIQKLSPDGTLLAMWGGTRGGGDRQFFAPTGIAVDSSNNVYVVDHENARIQKFNSDGTVFLGKFGSRGDHNDQFSNLGRSIAVDRNGYIYVGDAQAGTENVNVIKKFSPGFEYVTQWGENGIGMLTGKEARGITVDSAGNVYTIFNPNIVKKFTSTGQATARLETNDISDAGDIAVDGAGNLYITSIRRNAVVKFAPKVSVTPVVASFTASPTSGTAPLAVQFVSTSTGSPTSWSWSFGDGSTSTQQYPSHVYTNAGTYTARLTVSKSGVASSTTTRTISVTKTNSLGASFTANPTSGTAPRAVQFIDTSTGSPTSWSWNFGDGTTSTLRNPSHTYSRAGTFTARLTVAKPGFSSSTTTRTITMTGSVLRPDLTLTAFNGPDTGIRGRTIAVDATIKNQGALAASGFYVRYYLSTDASVTTGDRLLYTRYVSSLARGASSSTRTYVTIPTAVAKGTYYLGGIVDPTYRVSETNEGNNVKVDTGRLRIS